MSAVENAIELFIENKIKPLIREEISIAISEIDKYNCPNDYKHFAFSMANDAAAKMHKLGVLSDFCIEIINQAIKFGAIEAECVVFGNLEKEESADGKLTSMQNYNEEGGLYCFDFDFPSQFKIESCSFRLGWK